MKKLSDNCLLHIFNYLGLLDKISVACVSHRFAGVIYQLIGKEVVDLSRMEERTPRADLTQFLSILGKFIRRVKIHPNYSSHPPFPHYCFSTFVKHCSSSNLEEVDISWGCDRFECGMLDSFLENCTKLRVATLRWFRPNEERQFRPLHGVRSLYINGSPISGLCLLGARNLVDLSLPFCSQIDPKYAKCILENNKKLKRLNIRSCDSLTSITIGQALGKHQNIERISVDIRFFEFPIVLPELPHLKQIAIFNDDSFQSQHNPVIIDYLYKNLLKQLCHNHSRALESLELHSWDLSFMTDWPPFQSLTNLKLINARYLTDGLLKKISETCSLLERADLRESVNHVTDEGLLDFVRASTNLSYLNLGCNARYSQKFIFKIGEVRRYMGITDPLTIVYNRWMFLQERLTQHDDPTKLLRLISSPRPNYLNC
ncbi:uncharacterized protein LOC119655418 [Hermetia illucens]|uniref:uncharacterized protein LOC119655418 n=1 Tax=Hermetia illucens TaxID=343691 RepID=UPI0018CC0759|nr:uncharacterized protein LOC119655418 [Hermetia illucens]